MLSAAYEAITNSRFRVFTGHDVRLGFRMNANDGLAMVPARVVGNQVHLMMGTTKDIPRWKQFRNQRNKLVGRWDIGVMYAAWLRCYKGSTPTWKGLAVHGNCVWAYITKWKHNEKGGFEFWNVEDLVDGNQPEPTNPPSSYPPIRRNAKRLSPDQGQWVFGHVCITNENIENKHDERIFFINKSRKKAPQFQLPLKTSSYDWREQWRNLIQDYQDAHRQQDIWRQNEQGRPIDPEQFVDANRPAISRQIYLDGQPPPDNFNGTTRSTVDARQLGPGNDLCYVRFDKQGRPVGLYPVMISRDLHQRPPSECLDPDLHPAPTLEHLSPADRVFGWVRQTPSSATHLPPEFHKKPSDGIHAYRGQLRVTHIKCQSTDALQEFDPGLPLAILGEPKPQQFRYYATQRNGQPVPASWNKEDGYSDRTAINRRKVYPHHAGVPSDSNKEYWQRPKDLEELEFQLPNDANEQKWYREFVRHSGKDDTQNRTIKDWVRPNVEFTFNLEIVNLSEVELGALLWLLRLPSEHFLRFGGGKPIGFGSVALSIESLELQDGHAMKSDYLYLSGSGSDGRRISSSKQVEQIVQAFQAAVVEEYDDGETSDDMLKVFEQVDFIRAFLITCRGWGDTDHRLPTHYPRDTHDPKADGNNYEWFVNNERQSRHQSGRRLPLPSMGGPATGLPLNPQTNSTH